MITYLITPDESGLFAALFYAYKTKKFPIKLVSERLQLSFTEEMVIIPVNAAEVARVKKCLYSAATKNVVSDVKAALKSNENDKLTIIFNYLRAVVDDKTRDISKNYAMPSVLAFSDLISRIYSETHKMKGFLRFEESEKGFLYAHYAPDNDITEYLAPHFVARFSSIPFVIHDVKRNVVFMYDGKESRTIDAGASTVTVYLSENEKNFRNLWRTYYDSITIAERKNEKQMYAYMPRRYHEHLPEKNRPPE